MALRPVAGVVWLLLLVLPWFIAIVGRAGDELFAESVGHDMLAKVVSARRRTARRPASISCCSG